MIHWDVLWAAVKEPLRLLAIALVSFIVTDLIPHADPRWAIVLTFVLRFADQYLHELGKATNNDSLTLGLTRF